MVAQMYSLHFRPPYMMMMMILNPNAALLIVNVLMYSAHVHVLLGRNLRLALLLL